MTDYAPIFAKAEALDPDEMAGWYAGKHPRRMRIIPFDGPVPSADGKGRDLDGEYFDDRTDIKPHWFSERPVLFHHGADPTGVMGDTVLGKAVDLHMEDDGWWEKVWWTLADARARRFQSMEAKGAVLYGSSTPLQTPGVRVRRGKDGHIEQWPHAESTLSFSPQNNRAVLRPAKALLEDAAIAQIDVLPYAKALIDSLDDLGADLPLTSYPDADTGDAAAKAGRVLSARNERAIREAQELLDRVLLLLRPTDPPSEGDAS